nr:leucine-rich repeat-containing G-protein coupled receptor 5-like isoform X2 [Lepeophtheirus salmonis]
MGRTFLLGYLLCLSLLIKEGSSWKDVFGSGYLNETTDEPCKNSSSPCLCRESRVDCSNKNLDDIPQDLSSGITSLNLNGNVLGNGNFSLQLTFSKYLNLRKLSLSNNHLKDLPSNLFQNSTLIHELKLNQNGLSMFPVEALKGLTSLKYLDISSNSLEVIGDSLFVQQPQLESLNLGRNKIETLHKDAFKNLHQLQILILEDNRINSLESSLLQPLTQLSVLNVAKNRIKYIPHGVFQQCPALNQIEFKGNPIESIDTNAFSNLPNLKKLIISEAKFVTHFVNLTGTTSLEQIRFDRGAIKEIPSNLCSLNPNLKMLELKSNALESLPDLRKCKELRLLDLAHNKISHLISFESNEESPFSSMSKLHDLLLNHNYINNISSSVFLGLDNLQILDLSHNGIEDIHDDAFANLTNLKDVNLGENKFSQLPSKGMESVTHLKVHNNPSLRDFPGPERFPLIQSLVLSYAYHCCQFLPSVYQSKGGEEHRSPLTGELGDLQETVFFPGEDFDASLWSNESSLLWSSPESEGFNNISPELWQNFGNGVIEEDFFTSSKSRSEFALNPGITCTPSPGPFMPCNDLFDWWALRCSVWIVFLLALLGNGCVVIVLVASRGKMDVPRFLVCNLAMADFFMGIYLGFLAVVDASTLGEFRKYAIPWQFSAGCQAAGFFGVLSSELSVFTLAVITLERNYAITHAMHLNKRLSLKHAAYIMIGGWTFGLLTASLPFIGISDYRKFAICLPFETGTPLSLGYVVFLMVINGVAFSILMGCYLKMYCAIRGSQAWNSNDSRIAKRMALLVFTDFICWAPIAFFSLTAAFGVRLVSLEGAKVFTVFVLPLNSCCNPFLYAILTKQFKKDCVMICKAVEESRVTRGIGRCRHSSNFSNRQTPANTNSLLNSGGAPVGSYNNTRGTVCSCNAGKKVGSGHGSSSRKINMQFTKIKRLFLGYRKETSSGSGGAGIESLNSGSNDYPGRHHHHHHHTNRLRYPPGPGGPHSSKQPARRNASVSSDNFSSSRSDSWKIHGRIRLDHSHRPNYRRRNSWTVTRKPSQDSNNSRIDSASSNSTNTWRMSRSSVSSDAGKSSSIGSSTGQKENPHLNVQSTTGKFSALARTQLLNRHFSSTSSGDTNKPKLIRQSAILADENSTGSGKSVSFINDTPSSKSSSSCPLHHHNPYRGGHLQSNLYGKLIESSHEADDEEDEDLDQRLAEKRKLLRTPSRSLTDLSSTYLRSNPFPDYESPEVKKSTSSNNTTTSALVEGGMNPAEKEKKPHYPESPTPTESDHLLSKDSSSHTIRTEKGYLNTDV